MDKKWIHEAVREAVMIEEVVEVVLDSINNQN